MRQWRTSPCSADAIALVKEDKTKDMRHRSMRNKATFHYYFARFGLCWMTKTMIKCSIYVSSNQMRRITKKKGLDMKKPVSRDRPVLP